MSNSNQNPTNPNFNAGVGRLVTDRYDFEKHVEGTDFRHTANLIDMKPVISFDGYTPSTVQDAITALANIVSPPTIVQATESVPGIVQLSNLGDISGNALAMRVVKVQGANVAATPPTNLDVLSFVAGQWTPTSRSAFAFAGGQDLSSTSTNNLQIVVGLSGDTDGYVTITAPTLSWSANVTNPLLQQSSTPSGNGKNITIAAQTSVSAGSGGNTIVKGGNSATNTLVGGVVLQLGDNSPMLQAGNSGNGRVISLFNPSMNLGTSLPNGTGDLVLHIAPVNVVPTTSPSVGSLLYSDATTGQVWIKQADGNQFPIGSIPNPSTWGMTGGPYNIGTPPSVGNVQEYTYRYSAQTNSSAQATLNFSIPANTALKIDALLVGKKVGTSDSAQYNLSAGFVTDSSSNVTSVGSLTSADPRTTAGASGWTAASLSSPGVGTIQVTTGANSGTVINWTIIVQMVLVQG